MTEHKRAWCNHCGREVVICGTCGNGTCNGGYGTVNGTDCPDCPSAYKLDTGPQSTPDGGEPK